MEDECWCRTIRVRSVINVQWEMERSSRDWMKKVGGLVDLW